MGFPGVYALIVMDKPGAGNGRMSIAAEKCFPSGRPHTGQE